MASPRLLNSIEASERLQITNNTLRHWRMQGKGPVYKKIGAYVRYTEAEIDAWIEAQTRISTSQKAPLAVSA